METSWTVFVVDDDEAVRDSLRRLMESVRLDVETFASAEAFRDAYDPARPGCLILDARMPSMNGLELQELLTRNGHKIPVIIISAHGDVEQAVRAIKHGALDFIKKPYSAEILLERIQVALELDAQSRRAERRRVEMHARLGRLTPREEEIMRLLVQGQSAKEIALALGVSRKTVDVHRGHITTKMQASSLVELANMAREFFADGNRASSLNEAADQRTREMP